MNERELLIEPTAFMAPGRALDALTAADAERRPPGSPHSIAGIVAHLAFWQQWFGLRAKGTGGAMASHAAEGWPEVSPGSWPAVQERFLSGLEGLLALGASGARPVAPPIEYPPLAAYTVHDALVHVAVHNAHHLGQVVLLRQQLGCWPPPAGAYTW